MDIKTWSNSKTIWGGIIAAIPTLTVILKYFGIDIADVAGPLGDGIAGLAGLVAIVMVIVGRVKARFKIGTSSPLASPMIKLIVAAVVLPSLLFTTSCTQGPVYPGSPTAKVGADFQAAATQAIAAYAEYKKGNVDITWALSKMFDAYSLYQTGATDVKQLIASWTGKTGDSQALADRLARIFGGSPLPPGVKMQALAEISRSVAAVKG